MNEIGGFSRNIETVFNRSVQSKADISEIITRITKSLTTDGEQCFVTIELVKSE